jgi:hypothetical protein
MWMRSRWVFGNGLGQPHYLPGNTRDSLKGVNLMLRGQYRVFGNFNEIALEFQAGP